MICEAVVNGVELSFETSGAVFSPGCVDRGTLAMLAAVDFSGDSGVLSTSDSSGVLDSPRGVKLLDLGCGYGVVGIYAAKLIGGQNVFMSDIDARCISLSEKNAARNTVSGVSFILSDGFKNINEKDFTLILSNPPYHADFSIPKHFIEKGFNRLAVGGRMLMVTKRKDWYKNKLAAVFGGVRVTETDGYFVFDAEKRGLNYANKKRR